MGFVIAESWPDWLSGWGKGVHSKRLAPSRSFGTGVADSFWGGSSIQIIITQWLFEGARLPG